MYIIPAIDLRSGKVVRLIQGDYHRQIDYRDDPVKQAEEFADAGAQWLHVVDLDGAKVGRPVNTETIAAIAGLSRLKVEVGGGIRNEEAIRTLLDLRVERVIIGTQAVRDFAWFGDMAEMFRGRLVLGLDAKGSSVATAGWTQQHATTVLEFAEKAAELPISAIIYTDISKDGMMSGPNFERTKALIDAVDVPVVASGGINSLSDVVKLAEMGASAAIIGRALYEGTLDLRDAIRSAGGAI
jgi:phosphoribosylformimino-5-aminoimidazole carboxamide ribotide isomerase